MKLQASRSHPPSMAMIRTITSYASDCNLEFPVPPTSMFEVWSHHYVNLQQMATWTTCTLYVRSLSISWCGKNLDKFLTTVAIVGSGVQEIFFRGWAWVSASACAHGHGSIKKDNSSTRGYNVYCTRSHLLFWLCCIIKCVHQLEQSHLFSMNVLTLTPKSLRARLMI